MKYKVKILKQPKYQDGGNMQQGADVQSQVIQIIKAYAEANDMDPQELVAKLKSLGEKEQQQAIAQMYQALQQGGDNQQEEDYAQEQMQPGMQQQMGYEENDDEESDDMGMAAYGGQMGYGLDLGSRRLWMNQDNDEQSTVHRSIKEVPRNEANIEAEGGETALIPSGNDNTYSHFNIQGKRHTNGGVPLNVPEGTFIYSDTKKMKLGGSVLKVFGKSDKTSKKYTPAALAKQYDLNKYTAILENPNSSKLEKRTAELMIQNYNKKLAQLALVQEGKKGYPQGIPKVAEEYYAKTKAYVQSQQVKNQPQQKMQEQQSSEDVDQNMEQPQAMYGMGFKYGGGLQRFQGDVEGSEYKGIPYSYDKPELTQNDLLGNYATEGNNQGIINSDNNYSLNSFTTPTYSTLGIKMPANKYSGFGMQNTPNYDDPNLANVKLGMQNNNRYLPEEDQGVFKLGLQKPYVSETKEEDAKKKEENKEEDYTNYKNNIKYGWTNPDKLNLLNSFINLAGVRETTPFEPTVKFQRPETRFYDPARELAANTEQYNAARQASAMFAGPQSRYSLNAGQYGKNAADIIAKTSNLNVQLGNAAASQAADITNKQIAYDAQRAKRLYDAGVIGKQQYQNAMRQARAGVLQAYTQGMRNAADLYNMSMSQSPYYAIDPKTQTIYFNSANARNRYFKDKATASSGFGGYTKSQLEDASEAAGYGRKRDQVKEFLEDNAKMNAIQNRSAKANETGYGV
jgi:hypothetical protein